MRTRLLAACAALFVALGATGCARSPASDGLPVRVLVYNIHAGTDAKRIPNLERVAEIVRMSRADVVLLQEVDNGTRRSGDVDQTARLKSLTGFQGVFGKAIDYDGGQYGIAILSRWPIVSHSMVVLPVDSAARALASYESRGALVAIIAAPGGMLRAIDTHLDASRDANRLQQARTLVAVSGSQRDSGATIVGGDFNSEPGSGVVPLFVAEGWMDAFLECGSGAGLSFPADVPVKRIDYLLLSRGTRCAGASVLATDASDHRPVMFEIVVPGFR